MKRGVAAKGSHSEGCRGAENGQACTKDRTRAVALRAALESAVQLGRGDEVNRQAEMANPTKCRDSLQVDALGLERAKKLITFCFNCRAQQASMEDVALVLSVVEDEVVEATNGQG
jgi:hypothetical protein